MIATGIDAGNLTYFSKDAAGGLIDSINSGNAMDFAIITVSDDTADVLISIAINAGNSGYCAEDAAGGYIADIDVYISIHCADLSSLR